MAEVKQIKKLYILYILDILKKYSDEAHRLSQADIISYMKKDYDVECERKSIARNIGDLRDLGFEIVQEKGYYLAEREFEDSELRLLIDSVMASRYIPKNQAKDLVQKLIGLSNVFFKKQARHICNLEEMGHVGSSQLFLNIEIISEAIDRGRKVEFYYNSYGADKKLHHTTDKKHLINPYQIVVANGRYYLISNIDKRDNLTHFRVERISDVRIIDEPVKPQKQVEELKNGLDLPKHMVEHVYMFSGDSVRVKLFVQGKNLNDIIDWLGKDVIITPCEDGNIVEVYANEQAMKYWAIQFGEKVEVLEPASLRETVKESLLMIYEKYKG